MIQMDGWDKRKALEDRVKRQIEYWFNMRMNCGGYALKLDTCIFGRVNPNKNENVLETNVTYSYMVRGGLDFEDTALKSITEGKNSFEYHDRNYIIDIETEEIYCNGEMVATIMTDENETVVVIEEIKRDFISNTQSSTYQRFLDNLKMQNKSKVCRIADEDEVEL